MRRVCVDCNVTFEQTQALGDGVDVQMMMRSTFDIFSSHCKGC